MEDEKKIYIGNLEYGVTDEELRTLIEGKGIAVKEIKIITDKFTGKSKGFAFAELSTPGEVQQAIDSLDGQELNGRKLRVNKAKRQESRSKFNDRSSYNSRDFRN